MQTVGTGVKPGDIYAPVNLLLQLAKLLEF